MGACDEIKERIGMANNLSYQIYNGPGNDKFQYYIRNNLEIPKYDSGNKNSGEGVTSPSQNTSANSNQGVTDSDKNFNRGSGGGYSSGGGYFSSGGVSSSYKKVYTTSNRRVLDDSYSYYGDDASFGSYSCGGCSCGGGGGGGGGCSCGCSSCS